MKKRFFLLFSVLLGLMGVENTYAQESRSVRTEEELKKALDDSRVKRIILQNGTYDFSPGTVSLGGQTGWILPINREVIIQGEDEKKVIIKSTTHIPNGSLASQNLITIFADNVTLENLTLVCKTEINKVIEVLGSHVTLRNITCLPPEKETFAGSVYFSKPDVGVVTLENLTLDKGRITFTGAQKGTVKMKDVKIDYQDVNTKMQPIQAYSPIGAIAGKLDLNVTAENVRILLNAGTGKYSLDANTIAQLPAGATLELADGTYGTENTIQSYGMIQQPGITIRGISVSNRPRLYGTFQVMSENCTIENLEFFTKGGIHPVKNAIDVVSMSATIRNNVFNLLKPAVGRVGNGICVWPYGASSSPAYTILDNEFRGFDVATNDWSSTGLILVEGLDLSRFGGSVNGKSKQVTIPDELSLWTENRFSGCYSDYVHVDWSLGEPVYSFAAIRGTEGTTNDAVATAIAYGATQICVAGTIGLTSQLVIDRPITLQGLGVDNTTLTAVGDWPQADQNFKKNLVEVQNISDGKVVLKDFCVTASKRNGVNVNNSVQVEIENVTILKSTAAGLTVGSSVVTARNLNTAENSWGGVNIDKASTGERRLPEFTFESGALGEAVKMYSDFSNGVSEADVAKYVIFPNGGWVGKKVGSIYVWVEEQKAEAIELTAPEASLIEAGQYLSASVLHGGSARAGNKNIAGIFSWKLPSDVAKAGTHTYPVVFTPMEAKYEKKEIDVPINDVVQYHLVTTGSCVNGKVMIEPSKPGNKYARGSLLTVQALPDTNYELDTWITGDTTYTVVGDATLTATFKKKMHQVTIAPTVGGQVVIDGEDKNGTVVSVQRGSSLSVIALPDNNKVLHAFVCTDDKVISKGTVIVDRDFTITATFEAKPVNKYLVTIAPEVKNGTIFLLDDYGNAIHAGSAITAQRLNVLAVPDQGYVLTEGSLKNGNDPIVDGRCEITEDAILTAEFVKQVFSVTKTEEHTEITITGAPDLEKVEYGTQLAVTVKPADNYKLLALLVNGKEIPNGATATVTADTKIGATVRKLVPLGISFSPLTFVYDKLPKSFVVNTIPAGVGGFLLKYGPEKTEIAPTEAGVYDVYVSRPADDMYEDMTDKKIPGGLVILKADLTDVAAPEITTGGNLTTIGVNGMYAWQGNDPGHKSAIRNVLFTPENDNYNSVLFSVWNQIGAEPDKVTLAIESQQSVRSQRGFAAGASTLFVRAVNGAVSVWNGSVLLNSGDELYEEQEITIKGLPDSSSAAKALWSGGSHVTPSANGEEAIILLNSGANEVMATFSAKKAPALPVIGNISTLYDGTIFGNKNMENPNTDEVDNWQITFKQEGVVIPSPTDAGVYAIFVSRPACKNYSVVVDHKLDETLTITPAIAVAEVTGATELLEGQSLAQSVISGTADVDGVFSWENPDLIPTATTEHTVLFRPTSPNYIAPARLKRSVSVKSTGVTLRTVSLKVTNPEKGYPVKMTLNDSEVTSGAIVTKGDKLKVTFSPMPDKRAGATINGADYRSGNEYIVGESGPLEVAVYYTDNTNDEVSVTGVYLDITSKTEVINSEFLLTATVVPENAFNKAVRWESSDETIATVNNGEVKTRKAGTCQIKVTTDEGGYTASCVLTVTAPVGIGDIDLTRVYTSQGQICIEPMQPVEVSVIDMNGFILYHNRIDGEIRVSVNKGVYVVRLVGKDKQIHQVKAFVR